MGRLLTVAEAAEVLRLKPRTLDNWRSRQKSQGPRYVKIGRKVHYDIDDLLSWIEARKVDPGSELTANRNRKRLRKPIDVQATLNLPRVRRDGRPAPASHSD